MIVCCDTCLFTPTCEEIDDFERDVLRMTEEMREHECAVEDD